ncbi:glycosyltransferase [Rhodobacteraceae bacterium NNCM2]|nr:glycosyltransferase [Coraliihabitans acroporae]
MRADAKTIIYLIEFYPELSQTFIFEEIRSLRDLGCDIKILGLKGPLKHRSSLPEDYGFADHASRPQPRPESKIGRGFAFLRDLATLALRGKWRGIVNLVSLSDPEWLATRGDLARYAIALDSMTRGRPHLTLCHFGPMGMIAARLKAMGLVDTPILTVFHGYDLTSFLKGRPDGNYDELFAAGDCMVPISEHWRELLIDLGAPETKIHVVRLGVDIDAFDFSERARGTNEPLRVISVGRLCDKKGQGILVSAVAELAERRPDLVIQLDLVGDGELRGEIENQVADLGLGDRIHLHGAIQNAEVNRLLKSAHVFALHSVTAENGDKEGIPVSIMEAMATGLPVVSTLHSGIPELVEDGASGLLTPERDVAQCAAALEKLADDPALGVAMGRRGREIIEQKFNRARQAEAFLSVIRSVG